MILDEKREIVANSKKKVKKCLLITFALFFGGPIFAKLILFIFSIIFSNSPGLIDLANIFQLTPFLAAIPIFMLLKELAFCSKVQREYEGLLKTAVLLPVFSESLDNCQYDNEKGFTKNFIHTTDIYPQDFNIYKSNDMITGAYHDVNIERADVLIQKESGSGKNKTTYTYFKGQVYSFEFNKTFYFDLQVIDKTDLYALKRLQKLIFNFDKVEMESEAFNKHFKVFGYEENEVFYILTPKLMEAMLEIKNKLNKQVNFVFLDNKLVIFLETHKDSLEVNYEVQSDVDNIHLENEAKSEISTIIEFIDMLELETTIFK